jgi:hypothetical protein
MRAILAVFLLFLLSSCSEDQPAPAVSVEVPELIAVKFFEAVLLRNDLTEARRYVVPTMVRVLDTYSSGRAYARTVLNMRFDQVEINVEDTNKSVREFYTSNADVMLIFVGNYDGSKKVDMRMVKMEKHRGKWLLAEIKADPFARPGV